MNDEFQVAATPIEDIPNIITELKTSFASGKTLSIEWRKQQLKNLWKLVDENEEAIHEAVKRDIGKPLVQTQVLEIILVKNDAYMLNNLDKWLDVEQVEVPPPFENWSPVVQRKPKGVCLVIGTWNYPITLTLLPFIGVIACGNTGILKPSELSPHTATLLAHLVPSYLDTTCFKVINGDKAIAQRLVQEPYGHILYTGGTAVGKVVMKAAAEHLTPVTLELGGRNAAIVTEMANLQLAATRIAWAKFAIAGQTCFAPNHVLVHESVYEGFVAALTKTYESYYQKQATVEKVGKIVNNFHWKRLSSLLASTNGKIILGGNGDEEQRFIEPTVITHVLESDPLVQDELFGPFLPVLKYSTTAELSHLQQKLSPTPLAVYVFSSDLTRANEITSASMAGTVSINDCMAQIAPTSLPFGGFGNSGYGAYRGKATIETFSHRQSKVTVPTAPEFEALLGWRYPYAESRDTVEFVKANLEMKL